MGEGTDGRALLVVAVVVVAIALGLAVTTVGASNGADTATERSTPTIQTEDSTATHSAASATEGTAAHSIVSLTTDSVTVASTASVDNETDEAVEEILDAIPDAVLAELPEGFVEGLLADLDGELADDILAELDAIEDLPDTIVEAVLLEVIDNIPEAVLNDADTLVEEPPAEIPAMLCRADDMPDKENRNTREVWGPTDVNAAIGNGNLSVATNELGTTTVFKYPNPSFSSQVKHHAMDRQEPYYGADPNSGTFLGLVYTTADGEAQFDWLRDWGAVATTDPGYADHVDQRWLSDSSDTLVTEFHNETLGLTVTVVDAVPVDEDVHVRDIEVEASDDSPVTDVEVVSYANFNLVDNKDALVPTQDWCDESENDADVVYDADSDAIVYETTDYEPGLPAEMIERAGPEFSVATAMAFDGESSQHQVAGDDVVGNHSGDPYRLLTGETIELPGNDSHTGQASTALTRDIDFENGTGQARVYFGAAGEDLPELDLGEDAVAAIERVQAESLDDLVAEKDDWYSHFVAAAPMPEGAPENVTKLSKRALVTLVQAWDPHTENEHGFSGTIVAGVPTQAPYGADWIRDGSYFNYALDRYLGADGDGLDEWVNQHNRWYMSLQQNPDGECPEHCHDNMQYYDLGLGVVPENSLLRNLAADELPFMSTTHTGEWPMNHYADGLPAGPLGGQIDQTAYGAYTLYDHYAVTDNATYLERVYPAIQLAADRMTETCVDEETGLQCPRPEDDNPEFTQTIRGGASAYMGLDAAAKAAGAMYERTGEERYAEDALAYAQRRDELSVAMDEHYWSETGTERHGAGFYGERRGSPSPRVAMSAFMRPIDHPQMHSHLESLWEDVDRTFSDERDYGQYETKELIGLGVAARISDDPPVSRDQLQTGVEWLADEAARPESTHVMGEAWVRQTYLDDSVDAAVSQPHVWQQLLTYMSALTAYGNESLSEHDLPGYESYAEWRRHDPAVAAVDAVDVTAGETAEATVTVRNDAPVEQAYHVTLDLVGPAGESHEGAATDVGPIPADGTETVTLSWEADAPGEYTATVTAWKAAATDENGDPDALALAEDPTALPDPDLRHVELDEGTAALTVAEDDSEPDDGSDDPGDDPADDPGDDPADDSSDDPADDADDDGAGFGVAIVALALVGGALVAARVRREGTLGGHGVR